VDPIENWYSLGEAIGKGKFASVFKAIRKWDKTFAAKIIDKNSQPPAMIN
jgi:RIO-like serine/threonine protein kinase